MLEISSAAAAALPLSRCSLPFQKTRPLRKYASKWPGLAQASAAAEEVEEYVEEAAEEAPKPSAFDLKSLFGGRGAQQAVVRRLLPPPTAHVTAVAAWHVLRAWSSRIARGSTFLVVLHYR